MYRAQAWLIVWCLVVGLAGPLEAANKIHITKEPDLVFGDALQVGLSAQLTLTGLAAGAGQMSTFLDRGVTAHPYIYTWRCRASLTGGNTPGQGIEIYLATSDGTNPDGQLSTTDAPLVSEKRRNLILLGVLQVDQSTTNTTMTAHGRVEVVDRFVAMGMWNGTSLPFEGSITKHRCTLTPWSLEVQ